VPVPTLTAEHPPVQLQFKVAATDVEAPGTVEVRADEGIVEAIVSVTGIEDEVKDIIVPGAYTQTLAKRRPKVIWHHNWEQPIGRVLHIEELHPGDSRLPHQTKDGQPWPAAAGGLLATMQFNLKSDRGREAFEAVRFYSESGECEWSIGYQVPSTGATRDKKGIRHIKTIDLYELSFVLFGAASQTGTLGVKAALAAATLRMETKDATGADPGAEVAGAAVAQAAAAAPAADAPVEPAAAADAGDAGEGADAEADALIASAIAEAVTVWDDDEWDSLAEPTDDDRELVGSFEGKAITPGGRVGDDSPVGTPGGRQNWVDKAGGLPRYIRMVAHALIRKGMSKSRAIATAVNTMKRWAAGGNNVSPKVQAAAAKAVAEWEAKKRKGDAKSAFHPGGLVQAKVAEWSPWHEQGEYAATKSVTPTSHREFPRVEGTFEERIQAVAQAVSEALIDTYTGPEPKDDDPAGDTPEGGGGGEGRWSHVSVDGTWPDRVIATCIKWGDGVDERESYEMNYVIADDGSVTLSEPEPVKLTMVVEDAEGDESEDPEVPVGDLLPVPDMVEAAVGAAKALLFAQTESKAGRVLSSVNEGRLKGALESLIAVLRAAGIDVDRDAELPAAAPDPTTTSPTVRGESKTIHLDPAALRAQIAAATSDTTE
jgi:hypothetical protein